MATRKTPGRTISKTVAEHGAKPGEKVDIVDKKDKVLRTTTRVEAMQKGLRYRFVQVLVFNKAGEMWVQWRSRHKIICPRQYGASVGGVVEAGESYEKAAVRELKEEMGIKGIKPQLVGTYTVDGKQPYNAATFVCVWNGTNPKGWETEADALDLLTAEETTFLLQRFPYLFTDGLTRALEQLDDMEG